MAAKPKLIVLAAFDEDEDGNLKPVFDPRKVDNENRAKRDARLLATRHAGVIAWSREADPSLGEYGDPVILYQHGKIPEME